MNEQHLREHVLELLSGRSAHIDIESAITDFPVVEINTRINNSPHTAWELLEHLRIAQWDIVEFSRDPEHVSPNFPDGYWPKQEGDAGSWKRSGEQILLDLQTMRDIVADRKNNLLEPFPWGEGQTLLREALLVADHNAYHLGQLMLLKRMLEK